MSFEMKKDFFKLINNSVYDKTINAEFNNAKRYGAYKNQSLELKEGKRWFKILPFYVLIEKSNIKGLKSIDLLHEIPFYDELNIYEMSKAFKRCRRSYKIEIIHSKHPLTQLEASKSSIKDLFKDLLDKIKSFRY